MAPQKLFLHVFGEGLAQFLLDPLLEEAGDALQIVGVEIGVELDALGFLLVVQDFLEQGMLDAQHDVGIHLDEAAIAVIGEARIAGELGQALGGRGVEAEIEHRVHHAGHGDARARAHRDQQRLCRDRRTCRRRARRSARSAGVDLLLQIRRDRFRLLA